MASQEEGVMLKLNKISSYLSSFQVEPTNFKRNNDSISSKSGSNDVVGERSSIRQYYITDHADSDKQVSNCGGRIYTFGCHGWVVPPSVLSVYHCVMHGWFLPQPGMLRCCGCGEMLCLQLPKDTASEGYRRAVSMLQERVRSKHGPTCRWRSNPATSALSRPPLLLAPSHLYTIADASHTLAVTMATRLPHMQLDGVMDRLGVSSAVVEGVLGGGDCSGEQRTAVMLLLTGWRKAAARDTLRCELCKRSIGIWHFLSIDEQEENEKLKKEKLLRLESKQAEEERQRRRLEQEEEQLKKSREEQERLAVGSSESSVTTEQMEVSSDDLKGSATESAATGTDDTNAEPSTDEEKLVSSAGVSADSSGIVAKEDSIVEGSSSVEAAQKESSAEEKVASCGDDASAIDSSQEPDGGLDPVFTESEEAKQSAEEQPDHQQEIASNEPANVDMSSQQGDVVADETGIKNTADEGQTSNKRRRSEACEDNSPDSLEHLSCIDTKRCRTEMVEPTDGALQTDSNQEEEEVVQSGTDSINGSAGVSLATGDESAINEECRKKVFCPVSEHRYWCGWVVPAEDAEEAAAGKPGYAVLLQQLQTMLQIMQNTNLTASQKYSSTAEGVRSVRELLVSWQK